MCQKKPSFQIAAPWYHLGGAAEKNEDFRAACARITRRKLGIDVTAKHVTLGNGIPLQKLRAFQDAGNVAVLIIGDYTTRIGDPSGRSTERPIRIFAVPSLRRW